MAEQDNMRVMRELFDAANAHDVERIVERVDEAYIAESDTLPAPMRGREEYRQFLQMFYTAFPDTHYEIEQMISSENYVVTRLHITGTHRGEFLGKAPTNRRFEIHLCYFDQVKNGKVVRAWIYWDTATMQRQLGT